MRALPLAKERISQFLLWWLILRIVIYLWFFHERLEGNIFILLDLIVLWICFALSKQLLESWCFPEIGDRFVVKKLVHVVVLLSLLLFFNKTIFGLELNLCGLLLILWGSRQIFRCCQEVQACRAHIALIIVVNFEI